MDKIPYFYILSREADNDLQDIYDYTNEQFGSDQAVKYLSGIGESLDLLCVHPHSGRERNEIRTGVRSISYQRHIIFYRTIKRQIFILRVLHASRDLPKFL